MGGICRKSERPKKNHKDDKAKKSPAPPPAEDDDEDGDIATPKQDREGDDDQPL